MVNKINKQILINQNLDLERLLLTHTESKYGNDTRLVIELEKLPDHIRSDINEEIDCNNRYDILQTDTTTKKEVISLHDAIDSYLRWNGIYNFTRNIFQILEIAKEGEIKVSFDTNDWVDFHQTYPTLKDGIFIIKYNDNSIARAYLRENYNGTKLMVQKTPTSQFYREILEAPDFWKKGNWPEEWPTETTDEISED